MKILYSWLKEFVVLKESPEKVAERLSWHSYETIVDTHQGKDAVLEVSLLPNRVADSASHWGIAREIGLVTRRKVTPPKISVKESARKLGSMMKIQIFAQKLVRRYSLRGMTGVAVKDSPEWLKKRLDACGLRPVNNIVDAANYVMLELGQPLHAFDADDIRGSRIIVRQAKKGEMIETIERKTYTLTGSEILIADPEGPLGLAGVKGGRRGEISAKTKTIVIESANFDPATTRETSKRHNVKTDASWRFENNLDPNLTVRALDRVTTLIQKLAGGEILKGMLDYYPKKVLPWPIVVDAAYLSRLIGAEISETKIISLLKPFLVKVKRLGKRRVLLRVRTSRRDLRYPEDIAEEVARLIGYNNIPEKAPLAPLMPPAKNESLEFRETLKDHLVALGLDEVSNYSFINERDAGTLRLPRGELIEVQNPISGEWKYLRPMLFPNLLKNVRDNLRFFPEVRIFEIGKRYRWRGVTPEESWRVAGMISAKNRGAKDLFFEAKGVLESLLERLGFDREDYRFGASQSPREFDATLFLGDAELGSVGILLPREAEAYEIELPVASWGLDLEKLEKEVAGEHEFQPLEKYPHVLRDISILVPAGKQIAEIEEIIYTASPRFLEEVELFDVYEGEGIPEGQKSLAFHLIFRAPNRTLTNEEVDGEMRKISVSLEAIGAQIR